MSQRSAVRPPRRSRRPRARRSRRRCSTTLAARFRPGGLFLLMLRRRRHASPTTTPPPACSSSATSLPLLQYPEPGRRARARRVARARPPPPPSRSGTSLPGVRLAAFPYVEKRQLAGVLLLAAKGSIVPPRRRRRPRLRPARPRRHLAHSAGRRAAGLRRRSDPAPGAAAARHDARPGPPRRRSRTELDSLSGQLANTYEELSLIYQISSGMKINRRAADFFKQACLDVMEVMSVRGMGVALERRHLQPPRAGALRPAEPPAGQGASPRRRADRRCSAERKSPLLINDLAARQAPSRWLGEHAKQLLAVPLQRQDQVLGCLFALDKPTGEFDSVDSKLLNSIANESAIYLENAMLFEDVHGLMMGLLHSLTSAVDAKDAYTCGHSERVALLSRHLAQQIGPARQRRRADLHGRPAARRRQDRRARSGACRRPASSRPKSSSR